MFLCIHLPVNSDQLPVLHEEKPDSSTSASLALGLTACRHFSQQRLYWATFAAYDQSVLCWLILTNEALLELGCLSADSMIETRLTASRCSKLLPYLEDRLNTVPSDVLSLGYGFLSQSCIKMLQNHRPYSLFRQNAIWASRAFVCYAKSTVDMHLASRSLAHFEEFSDVQNLIRHVNQSERLCHVSGDIVADYPTGWKGQEPRMLHHTKTPMEDKQMRVPTQVSTPSSNCVAPCFGFGLFSFLLCLCLAIFIQKVIYLVFFPPTNI